jgi:hypothetical protein
MDALWGGRTVTQAAAPEKEISFFRCEYLRTLEGFVVRNDLFENIYSVEMHFMPVNRRFALQRQANHPVFRIDLTVTVRIIETGVHEFTFEHVPKMPREAFRFRRSQRTRDTYHSDSFHKSSPE